MPTRVLETDGSEQHPDPVQPRKQTLWSRFRHNGNCGGPVEPLDSISIGCRKCGQVISFANHPEVTVIPVVPPPRQLVFWGDD